MDFQQTGSKNSWLNLKFVATVKHGQARQTTKTNIVSNESLHSGEKPRWRLPSYVSSGTNPLIYFVAFTVQPAQYFLVISVTQLAELITSLAAPHSKADINSDKCSVLELLEWANTVKCRAASLYTIQTRTKQIKSE